MWTARPATRALRMLRYETKYFGGTLKRLAAITCDVTAQNHTRRLATDRRWRSHRAHAGIPRGRFLLQIGGRHRDRGPRARAQIVNETESASNGRRSGSLHDSDRVRGATFDPRAKTSLAAAFRQLDAAKAKGFTALGKRPRDWWHDFWRARLRAPASARTAPRITSSRLPLISST